MTPPGWISPVRVRNLPDGTILAPVAGCPYCGRWTRTSSTGTHRYPYHFEACDFRLELMPTRFAHIAPTSGQILAILPENADPLTWQPESPPTS